MSHSAGNMNAESTSDRPAQARTRRCSLVILHSLLFGLLFVPIVIAVLYGVALVDWWRHGDWSTGWIYVRGGFPCIGVFAIASASYALMRFLPCRFVTALAIVACGTVLCELMGATTDIMPRMHKSVDIHWLRPAFIAWLLIPPWLVAIVAVAIARAGTRD
jgi:hypothetical protein